MAFYYFPIKAGTKKPAFEGWQAISTTDPEIIRRWVEEDGHDLAIDCGKSEITVVDDDPGSTPRVLPPTYTVKTPRGFHRYLKGNTANSQNRLGYKTDTRGQGGYVVCPPTAGYEVFDNRPLAPLPADLAADLLRERAGMAAAVTDLDTLPILARAREWMEITAPAEDDGGGYEFACRCVDLGLSDDAALELMESTGWLDRCGLPFPLEEQLDWMRTKLVNAREYMQNQGGAWAAGDPVERFATAAAVSVEEPAGLKHNSRWRLLWPSDQDKMRPPEWLIPHVIGKRGIGALYAAPHKFKTFIGLDQGFTLSSTAAGWGLEEGHEPKRVLYSTDEGLTGIGTLRRPAWERARGVAASQFVLLEGGIPAASDPSEIKAFCEWIEGQEFMPELLFIDTWIGFLSGLKEQDATESQKGVAALRYMRDRLKTAIMVVAHSGKDEAKGPRGTNALIAGVEALHRVERPSMDLNVVAVHNEHHKDADLRKDPWYMEGKDHNGTLVFDQITRAEYLQLTVKAELLDPKAIAPLLPRGFDSALTTEALASRLYVGAPGEAPAVTLTAHKQLVKQLNYAAKHSLAAYCERGPDQRWLWFIP